MCTFFYGKAARFPDNFYKCKFCVYVILGGFYTALVKNRSFKKRDYPDGLAYVQLVQIDLSVVYREISQRCFDPDVRTLDEMRGMPTVRAHQNNTCNT